MDRRILHVDMDAFYASVEQRDRPELRGRPVVVGGGPGPEGTRRGVVTAASYEARKYGVRSAMPLTTALRKCPSAVVVPGRMGRYREVSRAFFGILDEFSPVVEPLSIDEAFLDLTGTEELFGPARAVAERLKQRARDELDLPCTVGVAPNKFLAKLGSDLGKPDGLFEIPADRIAEILDPLPVERLWGVGPATLKRFESLGIRTFGQVRRWPVEVLTREFGQAGAQFHRLARGEDFRPVETDRGARSISHEVTFGADTADAEFLRAVLLHQMEDVAWRLRKAGRTARTVTLKLRLADFRTLSRSGTLSEPGSRTGPLCRAVLELFDRWAAGGVRPLRLLGCGVANLASREAAQPALLLDDAEQGERLERLDAAMDRIRERFGPDAVRRRGPAQG